MSNIVKIYVRTDLRTSSNKKVPNGKMASQAAHALMGAFLSLFENKGDELKIAEGNEAILKDYINKDIQIDIIPIKSMEDLSEISNANLENSVIIKDQGRTSFSEPTITTMAISPKGLNYIQFISCDSETGERYASKQVIVINKLEIKDKWEMFDVVSECSLGFLLDLVKTSENQDSISLKKDGLRNWVNGAFAKITVKPKEKSFKSAILDIDNAIKNGVYSSKTERNGVIKAVSIGADSVDIVDLYTKDGYSLA